MTPSPTRLRLLVLALVAACGGSSRHDGSTRGDAPAPVGPAQGPLEPRLPSATGACPTLAPGIVHFAPAGMSGRDVYLWMASAPPPRGGPLVLYWHGTGSVPLEALVGLGSDVIQKVTDEGGIVAAPFHDPAAGQYPWFLTAVGGGPGPDDDLRLADEVVACAVAQAPIDPRRIHSVGMSAGALQTTELAYRRSNYLASVVTYSGGVIQQLGIPPAQYPDNPVAALIFYGGANDFVVISFQQASEAFWRDFTAKGHFAAICNHDAGHVIPFAARGAVWEFLRAHPFDAAPSPYARGLPADFPSYCALHP